MTYIQSLDPLIEARLDALRHQTAPAPAAEVMLNALPAESILLLPTRSASQPPTPFDIYHCISACKKDAANAS